MPTLSAEEKRLAQSALKKRAVGQSPSRDEMRALKKYEKQREEADRWKYYASIPKGHWVEMSGRQVKVLNEQAAGYGAPIGGATISLPDFIRWFHDFIADNSHKLSLADDEPEMMNGPASPWLEKYREEQARMARLKRLELEKQLLPRSLVHDALMESAAALRQAGERLAKISPDAVEVLNQAIDAITRRVNRIFDAAPLDEEGSAFPPPEPDA